MTTIILSFSGAIAVLVGVIALLSWRLDVRRKECNKLEREVSRLTELHNGFIKIDKEVSDEKKKPVDVRVDGFNDDNS